MAALPIIADTFRCALTIRSGAQYAVNVLNVRSLTGTVASVGADMVTILKAASSPYRALMANTAVTDELAITPLDGTTATLILPMGTDGVGLQTGEAIPNAPAVLSIRTARRGPAYRGRQFLPFIAENVVGAGTITSAARTTANASLNTWLALFPPQDIEFGVATYTHAEFSPFSDATIETALATQRRRQDRLRTTA